MENMMTPPQQENTGRSKMVKIVANLVIAMIGLSAGAAIVHGMVYQQCVVKKVVFIAGVLPPETPSRQSEDAESSDPQNCFDFDAGGSGDTQEKIDGFEAGVLPPEEPVVQESEAVQSDQQPSAQGSTPIPSKEAEPAVNAQTSAPAPAPQPAPAPTPAPAPQVQQKPARPQPVEKQEVAPAKTKTVQKKVTVTKQATPVKPVSVNLDKLSIAVAMQETHNCKDTRGAALLNNCHGFKKNGKFMSFSTPAESHAYFKELWVRSYGGRFPTYRLAQIYSGNDRPDNWLKNVTYYYNKL